MHDNPGLKVRQDKAALLHFCTSYSSERPAPQVAEVNRGRPGTIKINEICYQVGGEQHEKKKKTAERKRGERPIQSN